MGSAIQFNVSGVNVKGTSPNDIIIPSPNASNGLGIANCLISQKIVASVVYNFIVLSSCFYAMPIQP